MSEWYTEIVAYMYEKYSIKSDWQIINGDETQMPLDISVFKSLQTARRKTRTKVASW